MWNAALVLLRLLEREYNDSQGGFLRGKKVLDVGSGTGLIGIVCSILEAGRVYCGDLPQQMDLINSNIQRNQAVIQRKHSSSHTTTPEADRGTSVADQTETSAQETSAQETSAGESDASLEERIVAIPLTWGVEADYQRLEAAEPEGFDFVFCSDLLFCGIRADCTEQLMETVVRMSTRAKTCTYFIFQERIPWEEGPWLQQLKEEFSSVERVSNLNLDDLRDVARGSDDDDDDDDDDDGGGGGALGAMFYEEPPICCLKLLR